MKVRYGEIEDAISKIESASEAFDPSFMKETANGNELDVVKKLNELNQMFEEIGLAYKKVLKANNQSVSRILQGVKEVDQSISSTMKATR